MIEDVLELNLPNGIENSLTQKLENALENLADGNPNNDRAACNQLSAFVHQVNAELGQTIGDGDADVLTAAAQAAVNVLCP